MCSSARLQYSDHWLIIFTGVTFKRVKANEKKNQSWLIMWLEITNLQGLKSQLNIIYNGWSICYGKNCIPFACQDLSSLHLFIPSSPVFGHIFHSLVNLKSLFTVCSLIHTIAGYKFWRILFAYYSSNTQPIQKET